MQRDRIRPPWAYTAGLTSHGKPELVVTGLQLARAAELLSDVASHVLHADAPRPGEQVPLVHADDRGHWPWEKGFRGVRGGQPVLGVRVSPSASVA